MTSDPFSFVKSRIGEEKEIIIVMGIFICSDPSVDGNVPIAPSGYPTKGECVWEYEILGIISLGNCYFPISSSSDCNPYCSGCCCLSYHFYSNSSCCPKASFS